MKRYILRLDDASEFMDLEKWEKMEVLLDKYSIKPIFGIIPDNKDISLISKYKKIDDFWDLMHKWINKGWIPAMHGFEHRYVSRSGGINPVNMKSEFAGLPYEKQAEKIRNGWKILKIHDIAPNVFFAPSHTFDENTLLAIEKETSIRIISDTPAWDVYKRGVFCFVPLQSGLVRKLPFKTTTFCYHPNSMKEEDFISLETFLKRNVSSFGVLELFIRERKRTLLDNVVWWMYFTNRRLRLFLRKELVNTNRRGSI